nr:immunoglobulin light chain junction region [Macaca mulatta]MOX18814.1 immunoglobulin light chain junction region [Macaca mulatta]MOX19417.1 immunoglobulin light chain junction region [Macaca mulatta]MOX19688.1 immunoglobulin light chain junction region [Macaca mulatta]MOX19789.1 immunoglobulin light chain junction region [Macaca mulatta]
DYYCAIGHSGGVLF